MKPRLFVVLFCILLSTGCTTTAGMKSPTANTIVIAVRHAEAQTGSSDPGLTDAGSRCARSLAAALSDAGVRAIYVTQFRRTKETARPLASALGIPVIEVEVDRARLAEHPADLWRRIVTERPGDVVLVVGHSNTVPGLVEAATGQSVPEIAHDEFDRMYVLTTGEGKASVIAAQYGCE